MPQYFFDLNDGDFASYDGEGSEHSSAQAASDEAIGALAHLAKDQLPSRDTRDFTADVRDESGKLIFHGRLSFRGVWTR